MYEPILKVNIAMQSLNFRNLECSEVFNAGKLWLTFDEYYILELNDIFIWSDKWPCDI